MTAANPIVDTTLRIFDSAGNDTGFFNDDANNSFFAELFFSPRTDGDYFVDVGGFATDTGTHIGCRRRSTIFRRHRRTVDSVTVNGRTSKGHNRDQLIDRGLVRRQPGRRHALRRSYQGRRWRDDVLRDSSGNPRQLAANVARISPPPTTGRYYVGAGILGHGNSADGLTYRRRHAHANGDFNSNGRSDMLWRNANGELAQWSMDGGTITAAAT